jgi:5'-nucleotidase
MKTLLLTNDDGYLSPGIQVLKEHLVGKYHTYIVAPDKEKSAISMALTINRPLRVNRIGGNDYVVDGTPADCVNIAVRGLMPRPPDFIISGMNLGENLSEDIFFSGTVGGAFSGYLYDIPSLAVSLITNQKNSREGEFNFADGAANTVRILDKLITINERGALYNINIPYTNNGKILVTSPGSKRYKPQIVENLDPRGRKYYWIGTGNPEASGEQGTDIWAVKNGYISLTPLQYSFTTLELVQSLSRSFGTP